MWNQIKIRTPLARLAFCNKGGHSTLLIVGCALALICGIASVSPGQTADYYFSHITTGKHDSAKVPDVPVLCEENCNSALNEKLFRTHIVAGWHHESYQKDYGPRLDTQQESLITEFGSPCPSDPPNTCLPTWLSADLTVRKTRITIDNTANDEHYVILIVARWSGESTAQDVVIPPDFSGIDCGTTASIQDVLAQIRNIPGSSAFLLRAGPEEIFISEEYGVDSLDPESNRQYTECLPSWGDCFVNSRTRTEFYYLVCTKFVHADNAEDVLPCLDVEDPEEECEDPDDIRIPYYILRGLLSSGSGGVALGGGGDDIVSDEDCEDTDNPEDDTLVGANTIVHNPVDAISGHKVISETDLSVQIGTADFAFRRWYTSDPAWAGATLLGPNWSSPIFSFVDREIIAQDDIIYLYKAHPNRRYVFERTDPHETVWVSQPPSSHAITLSTMELGGEVVDIYAMSAPGSSTRAFFAPGTNTPPELEGLLAAEIDLYGNTARYHYGLRPGAGGMVARPSRVSITLSGDASPAGIIRFSWVSDTTVPREYWGQLSSIHADLWSDAAQDYIEYARSEYTYTMNSGDLGTPGDLVQVARWLPVDEIDHDSFVPRIIEYSTVTQYRYHTDSSGQPHQMKAVLDASQVERFADELFKSTLATGTTAGAYSSLLLGLDDSEAEEFFSRRFTYFASGPDSGKLKEQWLLAGCGCGSGEDALVRLYDYHHHVDGSGVASWSMYVTDATPGPSATFIPYRATLFDFEEIDAGSGVPFLKARTHAEVSTSGFERIWPRGYRYDTDGRLIRLFEPSAVASYTPADELNPFAISFVTQSDFTEHSRVYAYAYGSNSKRIELRMGRYDHTQFTDFDLVWKVHYPTVNSPSQRVYLPNKMERFAVAGTINEDEIETVLYEYGFHDSLDNPDAIAWVRERRELELIAENGPSGELSGPTHSESMSFFDDSGHLRWIKNPDGSMEYREYHPVSGRMTKRVANADPSQDIPSGSPEFVPGDFIYTGSVTGWGYAEAGGEAVYRYKYDLLGRLRDAYFPSGDRTVIRRELRPIGLPEGAPLDRPGLAYRAEITIPFEYEVGQVAGPFEVVWRNASGRVIARQHHRSLCDLVEEFCHAWFDQNGELDEYEIDEDLSPLTSSFSVTDRGGRPIETYTWWDPSDGSAYDVTSREFDSFGRVAKRVDANGTLTLVEHDVLDRVKSVSRTRSGTGHGSPVLLSEHFYDGEEVSASAVGDGRLTLRREHTGEGSEVRETRYRHDFRGRITGVENPLSPHAVYEHDNLGRVVREAVFKGTGLPDSVDDPARISDRVSYTERSYSQRGLLYRAAAATNPTASSPEFLEEHLWYDESGRVIKRLSPSSPVEKYAYDGLGRRRFEFITDGGGDPAPGAAENHAAAVVEVDWGTGDLTGLDGDIVLEQREYDFTDRGLLELAVSLLRPHDADPTEDGPLSASDTIAMYSGFVYDSIGRRIATLDYGTNDSAEHLVKGGARPTVPSTVPNPVPSGVLMTTYTYNDQGQLHEAAGPRAHDPNEPSSESFVTRFGYDGRFRRAWTAENATGGLDVEWDSNEGRWSVVSGLDENHTDRNRVTSYVYDGDGNVRLLVAHTPTGSGEAVQITEYVYGTDLGSDTNPADSLVASGGLLREVRYPDRSTGAPSTADSGKVRYAYNRLGELRAVIDQRGVERHFQRDAFGRVTADIVASVGGSGQNVDDRLRAVGIQFDTAGRLQSMITYTDTAMTAWDSYVSFSYNNLGLLANLDQAINDGSFQHTPSYYYDIQPIASGNRVRFEGYEFGGNEPLFNGISYGSTGSLNDRINRPFAVVADQLPGTLLTSPEPVAEYSYLGLSTPVVVDYPFVDVQLDRTYADDGARHPVRTGSSPLWGEGEYAGFDRHGRLLRQSWVFGDAGPHGSAAGFPNRPPLVDEQFIRDAHGNPVLRLDDRPGAGRPDRDRRYRYDGLDRLTEELPGVQDGQTFEYDAGGRRWGYDMLGNWATLTDSTIAYDPQIPDPFDDPSAEVEDRGHNAANELTALDPGGQSEKLFDYDDAGNMVLWERPGGVERKLVYDAWNRLVRVADDDGQGEVVLGEYRYNAAHWRVEKIEPSPGGTGVMVTRFVYDASWRPILEASIDDYDEQTADWEYAARARNVWGLRYIDEVLARAWGPESDEESEDERFTDILHYVSDPQFSVIAVLDRDGLPIERVRYDAYGKARHSPLGDITGDGMVGTADSQAITDLLEFGLPEIDDPGYMAEADFNLDGVLDDTDAATVFEADPTPPLAPGRISALGNPFGYTGAYFDAATGMYLMRHRHYSPELGRWAQRDPVGYTTTLSLYSYVGGNPLTFVDPLGLAQYQYHHMIPRAIVTTKDGCKNITQAELNAADLGAIFKPGVHSYNAIHQDYNNKWTDWARANQYATIDDAREFLRTLLEEHPEYCEWMSQAVASDVPWEEWANLSPEERTEHGDKRFAERQRGEKRLRKNANRNKGSKVIPAIKVAGKGLVIISIGSATHAVYVGEASAGEAAINEALVFVSVEDIRSGIADGQCIVGEWVTQGNQNVQQARMRNAGLEDLSDLCGLCKGID